MENKIVSRKVYALFEKHRSNRFVFVEPGGNYGDELIYRGAEKLARLAGLSFSRLDHEEFMRSSFSEDTVIYIHGGGGFVTWWSGTPEEELLHAVSGHRGAVIVGPSTFLVYPRYLAALAKKVKELLRSREVFIFNRERTSFEALKTAFSGSRVNIEHDHDTALNLTSADLPVRKTGNDKKYVLFSVRKDREMFSEQEMRILPFSLKLDPVFYCWHFQHWIDVHASAARIFTDRLHSAIVGHVFGIPVTLFSNNYHKNRSVWEYSLKDNGVKWVETEARVKEGHLDKIWSDIYMQKGLRFYYGVREKDFEKREKKMAGC